MNFINNYADFNYRNLNEDNFNYFDGLDSSPKKLLSDYGSLDPNEESKEAECEDISSSKYVNKRTTKQLNKVNLFSVKRKIKKKDKESVEEMPNQLIPLQVFDTSQKRGALMPMSPQEIADFNQNGLPKRIEREIIRITQTSWREICIHHLCNDEDLAHYNFNTLLYQKIHCTHPTFTPPGDHYGNIHTARRWLYPRSGYLYPQPMCNFKSQR